MKKLSATLLGVLAIALTSGCSDDQTTCSDNFCAKGVVLDSTSNLEAAIPTEWILVEQNIPSETPLQIPTQRKTTLAANDGRLIGCSGVNRYIMGIKFEGTTPTFQRGMSTLMAGPEADMLFEQAFLKALSSAQSFSLQGEKTLIVSSADQPRLLVFVRPEESSSKEK